MSCAPGALRLAFVYHFILYSSTVSWPGLSFSAFVWCSPSVKFVLIRSGSRRPLHQSALGAKCRSALGARGLFVDPLWERCVNPLWGQEAIASIRSGSDVSMRFGSERPLHSGDVMRSGSAAFDLRLPLRPVLRHRFSAWCFVQCFHMVLSYFVVNYVSSRGKGSFFQFVVWCILGLALTALLHLVFSPKSVASSSGFA
jgi:hypothetical protein